MNRSASALADVEVMRTEIMGALNELREVMGVYTSERPL